MTNGHINDAELDVLLSGDHGTVLTYSREAWEAMVDGYDRLRDREERE